MATGWTTNEPARDLNHIAEVSPADLSGAREIIHALSEVGPPIDPDDPPSGRVANPHADVWAAPIDRLTSVDEVATDPVCRARPRYTFRGSPAPLCTLFR